MHGFRVLGAVHFAFWGMVIIGPASALVGLISQSADAMIATFVTFEIIAAVIGYVVVKAFED